MTRRPASSRLFCLLPFLCLTLSLGEAIAQADPGDGSPNTGISREVEQLRGEVQQLRERLAQLELVLARSGIEVPSGGGVATQVESSQASAAPIANWGEVQEVRQVDPEVTDADRQRIDELRQEVDQLREEAAQAQADVADARATEVQDGVYNRRYRDYDDNGAEEVRVQRQLRAADARARAEGSEAAAQRDRLQSKQRQLSQAQQATQPQQHFVVSRDGKTVTLISDRPADGDINYNPSLPYVRWTGELLESDDSSERWRLRSLSSMAEAPASAGSSQIESQDAQPGKRP